MTASDLGSAVEAIAATQDPDRASFDFVLCDVFLGGEVGYDLPRLIADFETPPKVFYLSGNATRGRVAAINMVIDDEPIDLDAQVLAKPIDYAALHQVLRGHQS